MMLLQALQTIISNKLSWHQKIITWFKLAKTKKKQNNNPTTLTFDRTYFKLHGLSYMSFAFRNISKYGNEPSFPQPPCLAYPFNKAPLFLPIIEMEELHLEMNNKLLCRHALLHVGAHYLNWKAILSKP